VNSVADRRCKLLCVHLYDDFSGSARVFAQAISVLESRGHHVNVLVGSHGEDGFIRRSHVAETFSYHFPSAKWRLALVFAAAQWRIFWRVRSICRRRAIDLVYVNTVLPVGAIVAAATCGVRVLAHVHEVGSGTPGLFRALLWCVVRGAHRIVCVSRYVAETLPLPLPRVRLLSNSLDADGEARADQIWRQRGVREANHAFTVTMACSLKLYKGVDSFLRLADRFTPEGSKVRFILVLNCDAAELDRFREDNSIPENLVVIRRPESVFDVYSASHLVVNLSHVDGWIETFGLTLLEAMACGIPVISPQVGGCTELFRHGEGGWQIDSRDLDGLAARIEALAAERDSWERACHAARHAASNFSRARFNAGLNTIIDEMCPAATAASRTSG